MPAAGSWTWNVPEVPTRAGQLPPPDAPADIQFLSRAIDVISEQLCMPTAVTIVPDDDWTSKDPSVFTGKLVIPFDRNSLSGRKVVHAGRSIWITANSDYTTMSTATRGGEPVGVVRIQYPENSGWSKDAMIDFLASIHVGPGARPGQG
jgi:hypothetical protein